MHTCHDQQITDFILFQALLLFWEGTSEHTPTSQRGLSSQIFGTQSAVLWNRVMHSANWPSGMSQGCFKVPLPFAQWAVVVEVFLRSRHESWPLDAQMLRLFPLLFLSTFTLFFSIDWQTGEGGQHKVCIHKKASAYVGVWHILIFHIGHAKFGISCQT